jgi:hypothetical protein
MAALKLSRKTNNLVLSLQPSGPLVVQQLKTSLIAAIQALEEPETVTLD